MTWQWVRDEHRTMGAFRRTWLLLPMDLMSVLGALFFSFELRFNWSLSNAEKGSLIVFTTIALIIYLVAFLVFRMYGRIWRHPGEDDLLAILLANITAAVIIKAINILIITKNDLPWSVWLSASLLAFSFTAGVRLLWRMLVQGAVVHSPAHRDQEKRLLVYGAGAGGSLAIRKIQHDDRCKWHVVGLIDDHVARKGMKLHGIPIMGSRKDVARIVRENDVNQILIAIPSLSRKALNELVDGLSLLKIPILTIPSFTQWLVRPSDAIFLRPMSVDYLLGRDPLPVDVALAGGYLTKKTILVTGAGGSIGSEICRQVAALQPDHLVLLGRGENSIFEISRELTERFPALQISCVIGDIRDRKKMDYVFRTYLPQVVYHAAAHKHVPLMEDQPDEAYQNNVVATIGLLDIADRYEVERFILISSDKAVHPTSVMGASKRIAEMALQLKSLQGSKTRFIITRFGNVLGSRGSVVRIFHQQIAQGGPLTITDERMNRYFMTIPEAVQLVVEAGAIGESGVIFLFDMGEPVNIVDLAKRMIRLSGLEPDRDIAIQVTGMRPGEKLYEELSITADELVKSDQNRIFRVKGSVMYATVFHDQLNQLAQLYENECFERLAHAMKQMAWWDEPQKEGEKESSVMDGATLPVVGRKATLEFL